MVKILTMTQVGMPNGALELCQKLRDKYYEIGMLYVGLMGLWTRVRNIW